VRPDPATAEEFLAQMDGALAEAEILLESDRPPGTISRAYYAIYYGACALLAARGVQPKSHQGAIHLLSQEYVRPGRLEQETLDLFTQARRLRLSGDYGPFQRATPEAAARAVLWARQFAERVRQVLAGDGAS
jgi:uncharacterized protein (UPF0332 family)